jgi:hypothetical protein
VEDAETVRAHLADVVGPAFQGQGRRVNTGRVQLGLAQGKPQLRQVSHLVNLPPRRLEQDGGPDPAVNVLQRPGGVRVQGLRMRLPACYVGVD